MYKMVLYYCCCCFCCCYYGFYVYIYFCYDEDTLKFKTILPVKWEGNLKMKSKVHVYMLVHCVRVYVFKFSFVFCFFFFNASQVNLAWLNLLLYTTFFSGRGDMNDVTANDFRYHFPFALNRLRRNICIYKMHTDIKCLMFARVNSALSPFSFTFCFLHFIRYEAC